MCKKMPHLVSFVLVFVLFSSICRGVENHNALQEEGIIDPNIAHNPEPPDGAIHGDTWVTISWSPGLHAASHDVYIGEDFNDVNNGMWDTFMGNELDTLRIIGFPGTIGLNPGTIYYWRIDEVNDLHPDSPWKGNIWSFSIPSEIAHDPNPHDGAKFIDPNVHLAGRLVYMPSRTQCTSEIVLMM